MWAERVSHVDARARVIFTPGQFLEVLQPAPVSSSRRSSMCRGGQPGARLIEFSAQMRLVYAFNSATITLYANSICQPRGPLSLPLRGAGLVHIFCARPLASFLVNFLIFIFPSPGAPFFVSHLEKAQRAYCRCKSKALLLAHFAFLKLRCCLHFDAVSGTELISRMWPVDSLAATL